MNKEREVSALPPDDEHVNDYLSDRSLNTRQLITHINELIQTLTCLMFKYANEESSNEASVDTNRQSGVQ